MQIVKLVVYKLEIRWQTRNLFLAKMLLIHIKLFRIIFKKCCYIVKAKLLLFTYCLKLKPVVFLIDLVLFSVAIRVLMTKKYLSKAFHTLGVKKCEYYIIILLIILNHVINKFSKGEKMRESF